MQHPVSACFLLHCLLHFQSDQVDLSKPNQYCAANPSWKSMSQQVSGFALDEDTLYFSEDNFFRTYFFKDLKSQKLINWSVKVQETIILCKKLVAKSYWLAQSRLKSRNFDFFEANILFQFAQRKKERIIIDFKMRISNQVFKKTANSLRNLSTKETANSKKVSNKHCHVSANFDFFRHHTTKVLLLYSSPVFFNLFQVEELLKHYWTFGRT